MSTSAALFTYLLRLGDDNLVLGQQLGALLSRMPELESDIAVANVCLDHLGQARNFLTYAAEVEGALLAEASESGGNGGEDSELLFAAVQLRLATSGSAQRAAELPPTETCTDSVRLPLPVGST